MEMECITVALLNKRYSCKALQDAKKYGLAAALQVEIQKMAITYVMTLFFYAITNGIEKDSYYQQTKNGQRIVGFLFWE